MNLVNTVVLTTEKALVFIFYSTRENVSCLFLPVQGFNQLLPRVTATLCVHVQFVMMLLGLLQSQRRACECVRIMMLFEHCSLRYQSLTWARCEGVNNQNIFYIHMRVFPRLCLITDL